MNIKGLATIKAIYPDGSEETLYKDECNDICWPTFRNFFSVLSGSLGIPTKRDSLSEVSTSAWRWRIFYGNNDIKPTPLNAWYNEDGTANVNTDFPTYTSGVLPTDPDIVRFTATIQPPSPNPRTIRVIGIDMADDGSGTPCAVTGNGKLTILKLSTPCTQAIDVVLSVTYELYLYPNQGTTDNRVSDSFYTSIKSLLKLSCEAVNSVKILYKGPFANISSTPYDLSSLNNIGLTATPFTSTTDKRMELSSDGFFKYQANPTVTANAFGLSYTHAYTDNHANGVFAKNLYLIGGGIAAGNSNNLNYSASFFQHTRNAGDLNPVQNVYAQRNNPPGPSQDLTVNNTATMTGSPVFNYSAWVDPGLQRLVKINITGTGDVGVATYKLSVMDFIAGFVGNKWNPRTAYLPQTLTPYGEFRKVSGSGIYETAEEALTGGISYRSPDGNKFVLAASCLRNKSGINIYDIITGEKYSFNSSNGLSVTAVSDGEATTGYYYICCANTGLWRISLDRTTVEAVPSPTGFNKAFQICRKNDANDTIWVLFDGGLCKLSNPNAALGSLTWTTHNSTEGTPTFTFTGITDSNWANVTSMIIDPDNTGADSFLFVLGSISSTSSNSRLGFVWWDTTTGVAANPGAGGISWSFSGGWTLANLLTHSDHIRCSDGRWFASGATITNPNSRISHFTYAATNLQTNYFTARNAERMNPVTINGVKGMISCSAYAGATPYTGYFIKNTTFSTIPNAHVINASSAYVEFFLRNGSSSFVANIEADYARGASLNGNLLYLPVSNMFFTAEPVVPCYGVTPFLLDPNHSKYGVYKAAFWKDYGWDGSAWVLNHTGSKTVNSSNEIISVIDNMGLSFANGVSGTSFVANEWFIVAIGAGVFKDNGLTYNYSFTYSLYPTKQISLTGNVPQTPLGPLVDEPVTFSPLVPDLTSTGFSSSAPQTTIIQNKGMVVSKPNTTGNNSVLVADQLIPASTVFDFRFKFLNLNANGSSIDQKFGLATGTGTYTYGVHFRYNRLSGVLAVYNNNTLLETVVNPSLDDVFKIERNGSNAVVAYQNGVALHAAVTSSSQFVILADAYTNSIAWGWWDMKLTYTENRRVMRVGSAVGNTGSYSPKFSSLTYSSLPGDAKVLIGSGSPITAVLEYTSAGVAVTGTGKVKVCPGAGWLIFHDSEADNPVSGNVTAHFILNNL